MGSILGDDYQLMKIIENLIVTGNAKQLLIELNKEPRLASHVDPSSGNTLLMQALALREIECALALIPLCHCGLKNRQGKTSLILAASGGLDACVEELLPLSDVNDLDDGGMNALMRAAFGGHNRSIEILLSSPSGPALAAARNKDGKTALMHALIEFRMESAQLLLPWSDLSASTSNGDTVLGCAASVGCDDIVRRIVPFACGRTVRSDGFTPLMLAANFFHEKEAKACVEVLLPFSDVGFRSPQSRLWSSGMTAADVARRRGYVSVAALIDGFEAAQKESAELYSSTKQAARQEPSRNLRI